MAACVLLNAINVILSILSQNGINIPDAVKYIIAIISLAAPVSIIIFEICIDTKEQRRLRRDLKKRKKTNSSLTEV